MRDFLRLTAIPYLQLNEANLFDCSGTRVNSKNPSEEMAWNCRETLARLATPAAAKISERE